MELTQEYFDKKLEAQTATLKKFAEEQTEELARIISHSFDEERKYLEKKLDVTNRVKSLETDMLKIKQALHIS